MDPAKLEEALATLTHREQIVIKMRFGIMDRRPHALGEIANILGISREHVRTMEHEALAKLTRHGVTREYLTSYATQLRLFGPNDPPPSL